MRKVIAVILGAVLMGAAYPLFLVTGISAVHYLFYSLGSALIFLSLSDNTLLGRVLDVIGTLMMGHFIFYVFITVFPKTSLKFGVYGFIVILLICLVTLCCKLIRRT